MNNDRWAVLTSASQRQADWPVAAEVQERGSSPRQEGRAARRPESGKPKLPMCRGVYHRVKNRWRACPFQGNLPRRGACGRYPRRHGGREQESKTGWRTVRTENAVSWRVHARRANGMRYQP
jgi:hypothetical protein